MLFDIHKAEWDDELLLLFDIPKAILPHVTDSFGELGVTDHEVCFQTADLIEAMRGDWGASAETVLRVDGGMVASDWTMQRLADLLAASVDRPRVLETTALGAAYLAGLQARRQTCSPNNGRLSAALPRRWLPPNANVNSRFGAMLSAGL
jgi:glycerol kinase